MSAEAAANSPEDLGWTPEATGRAPLRFPIPPSSPAKQCRTCHAPIHWIVTPAGKRMPVNPDGVSHFATCEQADEHRKPKVAPAPKLRSEHLTILRLAAKRTLPANATTTRIRLALDECRRWNLLRPNAIELTPAGEKALEASRAK